MNLFLSSEVNGRSLEAEGHFLNEEQTPDAAGIAQSV